MKHGIKIVIAVFILSSCGNKNEIIHPEFRELTEAVYASGNVYPLNEYKVFANADGILQDVFIEEGDTVNLNKVLFHIESDVQDAKAKSAQAVYQTTVDNFGNNSPVLKELETLIASSKAKWINDSVNYIRIKNLLDKNATSQSEFDKAKLNFTASKNEYIARLSNLQKAKNQLYVDMQNAESIYKASAKEQSNFSVKSYISGMVYDILKERGEAVRRGEPLALLGDAKKVYAKLLVDELDIARIKKDMEVLIRLDYDKKKIWKARIVKVYPKLNKEDQSFRVDAEFSDEIPPAIYGLTLEANIIISQKQKTLVIPKSLLLNGDSVRIVDNGNEKTIKIQTGIENLEWIEVLDGLTEKSELIRKAK